jgi:hypothetical protein
MGVAYLRLIYYSIAKKSEERGARYEGRGVVAGMGVSKKINNKI